MSGSSPFGFGVASVELHDGQRIALPAEGLTVVTGSNNSGKSLFLREMMAGLYHWGRPSPWFAIVEPMLQGDGEAFLAWLDGRGIRPVTVDGEARYSFRNEPHEQKSLPATYCALMWDRQALSELDVFLINFLRTDERLSDDTSREQWDHWAQGPSHPVQRLWFDRGLHAKLSTWVERAFGEKVVINRHGHIHLRLSTDTEPDEENPPASQGYFDWYEKQPLVRDQGDGVRGFVNVLLHALVQPAAVVVIDEPEAFLHPPQARLLGKILAEESSLSGHQVIVATHSVDFLNGVLESRPDNTRLIRLSKGSGSRTARTLDPDAVQTVLTDPLTRYTNIMSGFFHDGVVVCEAEGDCRFYSATLEAVLEATPSTPDPNLLFIHMGGKARLHIAAQKLRSVGIPTVVVTDIDMLDNKRRVRDLVEALGGTWAEVAPHLEVLHRAAGEAGGRALRVLEVKAEMNKILGRSAEQDALRLDQTSAIAKLAKKTTFWHDLKQRGTGQLRGQQLKALQALLDYLAGLGAFLVPLGELECWHPTIEAGNKNVWMADVFEQGLHLKPSDELTRFTHGYLGYLTRQLNESETPAPAVEEAQTEQASTGPAGTAEVSL